MPTPVPFLKLLPFSCPTSTPPMPVKVDGSHGPIMSYSGLRHGESGDRARTPPQKGKVWQSDPALDAQGKCGEIIGHSRKHKDQ